MEFELLRPQLVKEEKGILETSPSEMFLSFVFWLIFILCWGYFLRRDIPEDLHGTVFIYISITTAAFITLWLSKESE